MDPTGPAGMVVLVVEEMEVLVQNFFSCNATEQEWWWWWWWQMVQNVGTSLGQAAGGSGIVIIRYKFQK